MDYWGGPSLIASMFMRGRQRQESQSQREISEDAFLLALKVEGGARSQGRQAILLRSQETGSSLEPRKNPALLAS